MGRFRLHLCKSPAQVINNRQSKPTFIKEMTELELQFLNNNFQLANDIADAIQGEDAAALSKYDQELTYSVQYRADISWRAQKDGTIYLDSKEEAEELINGEYEPSTEEVVEHSSEDEFYDYDASEYEVRISNLKLRNPSVKAQQVMEEARIEKQLVRRLGELMTECGIERSRRSSCPNNPQAAFIKEHAAELVKALVVVQPVEDEDEEPVEMFPTTRELKEMSSQN